MFSALIRPPVVWFAAAEAALIAVLGALTWHVWVDWMAAPAPAPPAGQVAAAPPAPPPGASVGPVQQAPAPPAPQVGPTPGIRTDAEFLSRQLSELNRVEATFEDLEWRVTKAIADAIQRYVEGVVLPSIDRSEAGSR
ncbi:MAG TPA: hypothetical protein VIC57_04450 [Candidatus Dormibacteraeota bacterium]